MSVSITTRPAQAQPPAPVPAAAAESAKSANETAKPAAKPTESASPAAQAPAAQDAKQAGLDSGQAAKLVQKFKAAVTHAFAVGASTIVGLDLPGTSRPVNRAGDPAVAKNTPAQAGAAVASGTSAQTATKDAGAAAALEAISKAECSPQTNSMIRLGMASHAIPISGPYSNAVKQMTAVVKADREALFKNHPELEEFRAKRTAALKAKLGDSVSAEELDNLVVTATAEEILAMNGVTSTMSGQRLIAVPQPKYIFAFADRIADRAIAKGRLPPGIAKLLKETGDKVASQAAGGLTKRSLEWLHAFVASSVETDGVSKMANDGTLAADIPNERTFKAQTATIKRDSLNMARKAGVLNPDDYNREVKRVSSNPTRVSFAAYATIGHQSIANNLRGTPGVHVTLYDPNKHISFTPNLDQLRAAEVATARTARAASQSASTYEDGDDDSVGAGSDPSSTQFVQGTAGGSKRADPKDDSIEEAAATKAAGAEHSRELAARELAKKHTIARLKGRRQIKAEVRRAEIQSEGVKQMASRHIPREPGGNLPT